MQPNCLFTSICIKCILEGKDYKAVYVLFPFIAAFTSWATKYSDKSKLTTGSFNLFVNGFLFDV